MVDGYPTAEATQGLNVSKTDIGVVDMTVQFPFEEETGKEYELQIDAMVEVLKTNMKTDFTMVEKYDEGFSKKVVKEVSAVLSNETFFHGFRSMAATSLMMVLYASVAEYELFPFLKGRKSKTVLSIPVSWLIRKCIQMKSMLILKMK